MDNETIEYISLSLASPEWFHDANAKSSYMKDLNLTDLYEHYSDYKKLFPRVNGGVPLNLFDLISNPHYGIGFTCQDMVKVSPRIRYEPMYLYNLGLLLWRSRN